MPTYERDTSTGAVLSVILNSREEKELPPAIEVIVESNVAATFTVETSVDSADWIPYTDFDLVTTGGEGPVKTSFGSRLQYIKVETAAVGNHKITIAGS